MDNNPFIDSSVLQNFYYKRPSELETRLSTWDRYGTNTVPFADWIILQVGRTQIASGLVLDAGCGTGRLLSAVKNYAPESRGCGIDISLGMVLEAKRRIIADFHGQIQRGDIAKIPYKSNMFDVVFATHVLYHVPNIGRAVVELRRVSKEGGLLIVSTSDYRIDQGLNQLHYSALSELSFPNFMQDPLAYLRFTPGDAEKLLTNHFERVESIIYINNAVFTEAEPCMNYYRSAMMYRQSQGPSDPRISTVQWQSLMRLMHEKIGQRIEQHGSIVEPGRVMLFKATKTKL